MRGWTLCHGLAERRRVAGRPVERRRGQVVADRVGQDEVAVGQALHQRAGAEPVGAVVGEVGLADHEQARDVVIRS